MSEPDSHRLFIAIAIPEAVKTELGRLQHELRELLSPPAASWPKPANMHLTLRFMGNVKQDKLGDLQQSLLAAVTGFGQLKLVCEHLGCFPNLRFPRVVWAGVHDMENRLSDLAMRITDATTRFAEKPAELRFTGHITVARPGQLQSLGVKTLAEYVDSAKKRQFGCWSAGELELISSELSREGSHYTTLATFPLKVVVA